MSFLRVHFENADLILGWDGGSSSWIVVGCVFWAWVRGWDRSLLRVSQQQAQGITILPCGTLEPAKPMDGHVSTRPLALTRFWPLAQHQLLCLCKRLMLVIQCLPIHDEGASGNSCTAWNSWIDVKRRDVSVNQPFKVLFPNHQQAPISLTFLHQSHRELIGQAISDVCDLNIVSGPFGAASLIYMRSNETCDWVEFSSPYSIGLLTSTIAVSMTLGFWDIGTRAESIVRISTWYIESCTSTKAGLRRTWLQSRLRWFDGCYGVAPGGFLGDWSLVHDVNHLWSTEVGQAQLIMYSSNAARPNLPVQQNCSSSSLNSSSFSSRFVNF